MGGCVCVYIYVCTHAVQDLQMKLHFFQEQNDLLSILSLQRKDLRDELCL